MKITAAHIHAEHGRATLRATLEGGSEQDTISCTWTSSRSRRRTRSARRSRSRDSNTTSATRAYLHS